MDSKPTTMFVLVLFLLPALFNAQPSETEGRAVYQSSYYSSLTGTRGNVDIIGSSSILKAVINLVPGANDGASGYLNIIETTTVINGKPMVSIDMQGIIYGLRPGYHSLHILTTDGLLAKCLDIPKKPLGSFNPDKAAPDVRHVGDLGNILTLAEGPTHVNVKVPGITFGDGGPRDVLKRTLVVQADAEELHGDATHRAACGIIEPL